MMQYEKNLSIDHRTEEQKTIPGPMVCNFFTKLLHAFLLEKFPVETLFKFYSSQSTNTVIPLNGPDQIISHLWDENEITPCKYVSNLLKRTELLCIENHICMNQKLKEFFSSALSSRSLQSQILGPVLKQMNSQIDMRPHVLRAVSTVATSVFLNASCKFISEKTSKRGKEYKFVIRQLSGCEDRNSALNIESSFVFLAMILPVTFLLPPFSQYRIDYHEQQVEDLLWENDESYSENGKLYLNGQVYGVQKTLWECAKQNIANQVSVADPEQWKVNVVEKDYLCPIRKRVVLKRGEVYGAPYSVVSIWDTSQQSSIGRYDAIIQDEKSSCIWTQLEKKQEELLKMFNKTINIVYDKSVEIVVINNASVVGGVQAKIFSAMLKLYIDKKRNIFEWRDLAAHDELICDPYSTGLSTRLSRLIETLQKINCGCIIKKITRGKYTLISDYHIRYSEKT